MAWLFNRYKGLPREIYFLFLARVITSIGSFVYPLLTLIMTDKLGLSPADAGVMMTLLVLSQAPTLLLGGKLADKYGRVKLIVVFQTLGAITYIICGIIKLSHVVVYLIVLASNFYAIAFPAMDAMTIDLTHSGNRKEALSLLYMGFNLGFAIGPMMGGILYKDHLSFVFIGDAVTTIISVVLVFMFVKETIPKHENGDRKPKLERFVEGSVFRVLWERKVILVFAFILLIYQFAYDQWAFALPLQMKALFENGASLYGILASFNGMLVIFLTPLLTSLIRKWKVLYGTFAGGICFAISFGILIFARSMPLFYVAMFILTLGEVISTIDSRTFIADFSPASHRARLNSVVNLISGTGRMISPLIIGQVIAGYSISAGWLTVSSASLFGAFMLLVLISKKSVRSQIKMLEYNDEYKTNI